MINEDSSDFFECPRCMTKGMLKIGQRVHRGKIRWYETVNCENCGLRREADGLGSTPDNIRRKIIEKTGLWQVIVEAPESLPMLVKIIREALGLDYQDSMRIAKSIPGVVYAGTKYEANWIEDLLRSANESPQLKRIE